MGTDLNGFFPWSILQFPHADKNVVYDMPSSSVSYNEVKVRGNTMASAPDGVPD
jgi:hypothetical protein